VAEIARLVGHPTPHVVGALVVLWSYADEHSTDGFLRYFTAHQVDAMACIPGVAAAMANVGWLETIDAPGAAGIMLPRYAEHNGETAKQRAQGSLRAAKFRARNATTVTPIRSVTVDTVTPNCSVTMDAVTRIEESRVEKSRVRGRARLNGI
jgi:hypothetical protein